MLSRPIIFLHHKHKSTSRSITRLTHPVAVIRRRDDIVTVANHPELSTTCLQDRCDFSTYTQPCFQDQAQEAKFHSNNSGSAGRVGKIAQSDVQCLNGREDLSRTTCFKSRHDAAMTISEQARWHHQRVEVSVLS